MASRIYLDNSASTSVRQAVVDAMLPYLTAGYGNASSLHSYGREARQALDSARATIAEILNAQDKEIIFTSGGTESNNLALKGVAYANDQRGKHIVISTIEHDSVLNSARWLATQGFQVTTVPVDTDGLIDLNRLAAAIRPDTVLVSIIHGNNEIGTLQSLDDIGGLCRERGVYFHADACQSFAHVPIDVQRHPVDLLTINAHKLHGPKGVGALYVRNGVSIVPWQHGGGHERGLRSSTENLASIVGFAKAAEVAWDQFDVEIRRMTGLRDRIISEALERVEGAYLNGHRHKRLPNNVNLGFEGLEGEAIRLLLDLDAAGIAVSSGSACSSNGAGEKPSHVLTAIGRDPIQARGALRVTLGIDNTADDVDRFLDILPQILRDLRPITSLTMGGGI